MKVFLYKNRDVACTLEGKNHDFLHDCYGCFDGYIGYGNLKMARSTVPPVDEWRRNCALSDDYKTLTTILFYAGQYGIEVEDGVRQLSEEWKKRLDEYEERKREKIRKVIASDKWQYLKKYGCGRCENCKKLAGYDDTYICAATYEELPTEDIGTAGPKRAIGEHYSAFAPLFWYAPYPTNNCPYKAEEVDKTSAEYLLLEQECSIPF